MIFSLNIFLVLVPRIDVLYNHCSSDTTNHDVDKDNNKHCHLIVAVAASPFFLLKGRLSLWRVEIGGVPMQTVAQ
jgi:hypothetical protein